MRFMGSNRVFMTFWPRDFKNPYVYPLEFREVHMQVPCGPVRMPFENTCTRGPYGAQRTQQTTGPVRAPVRSLHDCLRTLYGPKIIGSPCMYVVCAQFSGTGLTAPVRIRNLRRIARVCTACHAIIHGFSGVSPLRDP